MKDTVNSGTKIRNCRRCDKPDFLTTGLQQENTQ